MYYYYYYYYYYSDYMASVTLNLTFQKPTGDKLSLMEFNEFLQLINDLHKRVLLVTQAEYQKRNNLKEAENLSLISYHELELVHVCRENPINMKLMFSLASFSQGPYWAIWKVFIEMCKRYGKDTNDLSGTIESLTDYFKKLIADLKKEQRSKQINSILGVPKEYGKYEDFVEDLKNNLMSLLTDKTTMIIYNKFCTSAIYITDCVAIVDGFTDLVDGTIKLIESHTE